jgi:hypothetical protein
MEPISTATVVSTVGTGIKAIEHGTKGWNWLQKKLWGEVEITAPDHKMVWTREWIPVKGTHKGKKRGHYWLMTSNGAKYWPQGEVNFQHNGTWSGQVNLGRRPGPKDCIILVVWVDATVDKLLKDILRRNKFALGIVQEHGLDGDLANECWSPVELSAHSERSFSIMAHRTVQFPPGPVER